MPFESYQKVWIETLFFDDLSANRFANRFDVTHMSLKTPDDICSNDFLGIGQKLDNFEKQRDTEMNMRNEKLD